MLPGIGGKKNVKVIVWSGLLFFCIAARALATGFVGYLPMSDGEYAQKRALKPLLTLPYSVSPDQTWYFRQVGVSGVTLLPEPKKITNGGLAEKTEPVIRGLSRWEG